MSIAEACALDSRSLDLWSTQRSVYAQLLVRIPHVLVDRYLGNLFILLWRPTDVFDVHRFGLSTLFMVARYGMGWDLDVMI